jgi:hypothetical protein
MNDEAAAHYTAIIDNMALGIKFLQANSEPFFQFGTVFCHWPQLSLFLSEILWPSLLFTK